MIRVLIADDFPQMIAVMTRMIERANGMRVVDVITNFQDVLTRILSIEHEVVLMNDYLPPTTSVHATGRLRAMGFTTPIVVISMHGDARLVRDSLAAGANGFILKGEFTEHLLPAIRTVYDGGQYLSPAALLVLAGE